MPIETSAPPVATVDAVGALMTALRSRDAHVGILGMGYVGLPAALSAARAGFTVTGFDVDEAKVGALRRGESFFSHIPARAVTDALQGGRFEVTADFERLPACDAILICVPTPLHEASRARPLAMSRHRAGHRPAICAAGQLIVLESTTYPGTTDEVVKPVLEADRADERARTSSSPSRRSARIPGNAEFDTSRIPKVVGGDGPDALALADGALRPARGRDGAGLLGRRSAEAVKLTENIFRAVNIALVNELKVVYAAMGIDVWEVIEAAKTKPFGFMPFYPGPGLGGHCIPIDPFYLTWKAREYGVADPLHRAGRRDQHAHAAPRRRPAGRGAGPGARTGLERRARSSSSASAYKKNIDDIARKPGPRS